MASAARGQALARRTGDDGERTPRTHPRPAAACGASRTTVRRGRRAPARRHHVRHAAARHVHPARRDRGRTRGQHHPGARGAADAARRGHGAARTPPRPRGLAVHPRRHRGHLLAAGHDRQASSPATPPSASPTTEIDELERLADASPTPSSGGDTEAIVDAEFAFHRAFNRSPAGSSWRGSCCTRRATCRRTSTPAIPQWGAAGGGQPPRADRGAAPPRRRRGGALTAGVHRRRAATHRAARRDRGCGADVGEISSA